MSILGMYLLLLHLVCISASDDVTVYAVQSSYVVGIFMSLVTTVIALNYIPPFIIEVWNGSYTSKSMLMFGLISSFTISSYSLALFSGIIENGLSDKLLDLFQIAWAWSSVCTKIWKILIFSHTKWVLNLPNRTVEFPVLVNDAQRELKIRIKFGAYFLVFSVLFAIFLGVVSASVRPSNKQNFDSITVLPVLIINSGLDAFIVVLLYLIICDIKERSVSFELHLRLRWCCLFEILIGICSFWIVTFYMIYYVHGISASQYQRIRFVTIFYELFKLCSFITFFSLSFEVIVKPITNSIRYLMDAIDSAAKTVDTVVCCQLYRGQDCNGYGAVMGGGGNDIGEVLAKDKTRTVFDFGLDFDFQPSSLNNKHKKQHIFNGGHSSSNTSKDSSTELSQEQEILTQIGTALENSDILSLIIPPEFIKINATPFAAGGFGQVHEGKFCGKKVAVKKVFTQLSEGLFDEFNHEVRILNNLRGMPHVMLLHGVSFQMDQGERVFIMVLEWCPISLASIVSPKELSAYNSGNSHYDTKSRYQPSRFKSSGNKATEVSPAMLNQALLSNDDDIEEGAYSSNGSSGGAYSSGGFGGYSSGSSTKLKRCKRGLNVRTKSDIIVYSPAVFLSIVRQIANALSMLHFKGYVHRDLKPQNILFANVDDLSGSLRICDFGSARIVEDRDTGRCSDDCGISPLFSPPEVVKLLCGRDLFPDGIEQSLEYQSIHERKSNRTSSKRDNDNTTAPTSTAASSPSADVDSSTGFTTTNSRSNGAEEEMSYNGYAFDMYSFGMIVWQCWYQRDPDLTQLSSSSMGGSSVNQNGSCGEDISAHDLLRKTVLGYRPSMVSLSSNVLPDETLLGKTDSTIESVRNSESSNGGVSRGGSTVGVVAASSGPPMMFGDMPECLAVLVQKLWCEDPKERPTSIQARDFLASREVQIEIEQAQRRWQKKQ